MSCDVVFDESHPFYLCSSSHASPASLVDHLSFLLYPSSVPSSESSPVVLDHTLKPPVTQFYIHRGARLLDASPSSNELSTDVPSSSSVEDVPSSPLVEPSSLTDSFLGQLIRRSHRLHRPHDYYSPLTFTVTAMSESASYHDAILHPEWQHTMVEEIATLEQTGTWDLMPCPPMCSSDHL
jgi:hypothetical protein